MQIRFFFTAILLLVALAACQPIQPPADAGSELLAGTHWVLTEIGGEATSPDIEVTAMFGEDGRLSGNSGCNNYSTAYETDGQNISIDAQIMSTMMMCSEEAMAVEQAYLQALPSASAFAVSGETLTLSDAAGESILVFAAQSQDLAGTSWEVISYNNGNQAVVSVLLGTELTAAFTDSGAVAGSAGCNNYTGKFVADGASISVGPLASTMKMCMEEGVMEQEAQFLAAMESAATYSIDGGMLQFRTADDAMAANFLPAK